VRLSLLAGDLNFDISTRDISALIELKGFRNVFKGSRSSTRPANTPTEIRDQGHYLRSTFALQPGRKQTSRHQAPDK